MSDILIAYFSRGGNNYVAGEIKYLEKGNTEIVAELLQSMIGGDLYKIESSKKYPEDYYETTEVANEELKSGFRPELTHWIDDISKYDTIFLGYPNWWGTFPTPVMTFLEKYNFSGKRIFPFCTHEGSGLGNSERDLKKFCPDSEIMNGLAIQGSTVNNCYNSVERWILKSGFKN